MILENSANALEKTHAKCQIEEAFGQAAKQYDQAALVQKECAAWLLEELDRVRPELTSGNVIELGCGTGFLTQGLVKKMGDRPLEITDLSQSMLTVCQQKVSQISHSSEMTFRTLDGELWQPISRSYALIISSFVVQWFQQLEPALDRWISALKPGGKILISFPTYHSFPEWKAACRSLDLPFTGNPLPDPGAIAQFLASRPVQTRYWQQSIGISFTSSRDFFRSLKQIGAGTSLSQTKLSISDFKQLVSALDEFASLSGGIHYDVAYFTISRNKL
ncbi:methyltransferase domain-containing protein [Thermoleptolyngbya sichuanensis A183]|uniref:Methyltransferase domain-containing protein n=1 Tax=Thermoleptolyngbya sichuanensis A183 TaxID=2737172 RepID=A0A6M8B4U8_9CYAN|nr:MULTISPECIES: methyltransferase domain-containing protein [Thermoleptolyngbya]QKD81042.1 methyltransferase domain-containing protein [Thermoleptolyngbya sichuanensis A183]